MRNYFTFAGTDSRDLGVYISGQGTFNSPSRVYSLLTVPGRNGQLVGNDRRLENVELTYPAFMYTNFESGMAALRSFLLSQIGYKRLTDSYHPDEFRLALYQNELQVEATSKNNAGNFDITFFCKPQRYLLSGETVQTFTADGTITNPTAFDAQPLIRVYGKGRIGIGENSVLINDFDEYTDIDCEAMEAYHDATSCNDQIEIQGLDFPVLHAGENGITLGTGITKVEITPRWWRV